MSSDLVIRPAVASDLAAINEIYNHYVLHSTCVWRTIPYSEAQRRDWFDAHGDAMPVLVAQLDGRIVGWIALSSFRATYTANGTLEDSIFVHHEFRRQGIGRRLLTELIQLAREKGLRSILATISADQTASIRLHEALGFEQVAHLRRVGRKFGQWFDSIYLQLLLRTDDDAS